MNVKDIVALAHAGYNVEQINAIISAMSNQTQQPVQQMQQPMQQPMQQMQPNDPVLEQLRMLTGAVIQNNINGSSQPQQRNAEDIVASIINPKQEVTTNG